MNNRLSTPARTLPPSRHVSPRRCSGSICVFQIEQPLLSFVIGGHLCLLCPTRVRRHLWTYRVIRVAPGLTEGAQHPLPLCSASRYRLLAFPHSPTMPYLAMLECDTAHLHGLQHDRTRVCCMYLALQGAQRSRAVPPEGQDVQRNKLSILTR